MTILTKSARFLKLGSPVVLTHPGSTSPSVEALQVSESSVCFVGGGSLCYQSWKLVIADGSACPESFSGTYSVRWSLTCRNGSNPVCSDYLAQQPNTIAIPIELAYVQRSCDRTSVERALASTTNVSNQVYQTGETVSITVEVPIDSPLRPFVSTARMENVWVCTVSDFDLLPPPTSNGIGSGCLSAVVDAPSMMGLFALLPRMFPSQITRLAQQGKRRFLLFM